MYVNFTFCSVKVANKLPAAHSLNIVSLSFQSFPKYFSSIYYDFSSDCTSLLIFI